MDQEQFNQFMYNYERQKAIVQHQAIAALNNKEPAQQQLTQQGSEPSEISALVNKTLDDLNHGCGPTIREFIDELQKHLPC